MIIFLLDENRQLYSIQQVCTCIIKAVNDVVSLMCTVLHYLCMNSFLKAIVLLLNARNIIIMKNFVSLYVRVKI